MRVWLDDIRPLPEGYDVWVYTVEEAIKLINTGKVTHISLDNDLGETETHGYAVACYIEQGAFHNTIDRMTVDVHSKNPVAAKYMRNAIENANDFWTEHGK